MLTQTSDPPTVLAERITVLFFLFCFLAKVVLMCFVLTCSTNLFLIPLMSHR